MTKGSLHLDYAPPPRPGPRRISRWFWLVVTFSALMFVIWLLAARLWSNAQVMLWQSQWMTFALPPTQVVVEPDRRKAAAMYRGQSDYLMRSSGVAYHVPRVSGFVGDCVFLHGRHTPKGSLRLVKVIAELDRHPQATFIVTASRPATIFKSLGVISMGDALLPSGPPGERPRLYAGQPDPNDPSRFTIKYEYSDRSGIVHGALHNDDSISFEHVEDKPKEEVKP